MNKKDVFECQSGMELDTTYEIEIFLERVFNKFRGEALTEVNMLFNEYPFMGAEWQAINECQRTILSLLPKDIS